MAKQQLQNILNNIHDILSHEILSEQLVEQLQTQFALLDKLKYDIDTNAGNIASIDDSLSDLQGQLGTLDGKVAVATSSIAEVRTDLNTETSTREEIGSAMQLKIDALRGAIIYLGHVEYTAEQVTADTNLLTEWCRENGFYPLMRGYCVIDANANDWWWNDTEERWVNIGYFDVATATNNSKGVVVGNDVDLGIVVNSQGKMSVKNLQNKLDEKLNVLDSQNFVKVADLVPLNNKVSTLETWKDGLVIPDVSEAAKVRVFAPGQSAAALTFSQANPTYLVLVEGT
ncbi:MAG: hypothetical protein LBC87_12080 [Fibromonadaceae bacterium]|jgi:hypothetical protein|nr:hypothetical protein [Fibromonadaceae bacterium]